MNGLPALKILHRGSGTVQPKRRRADALHDFNAFLRGNDQNQITLAATAMFSVAAEVIRLRLFLRGTACLGRDRLKAQLLHLKTVFFQVAYWRPVRRKI